MSILRRAIARLGCMMIEAGAALLDWADPMPLSPDQAQRITEGVMREIRGPGHNRCAR